MKLAANELRIGWHGFLMYGKAKIFGQFKQHILRRSLLEIWEQLKYQIYRKLPKWIKPSEIADNPIWINVNQNKSYKELLDNKGVLIKEEG